MDVRANFEWEPEFFFPCPTAPNAGYNLAQLFPLGVSFPEVLISLPKYVQAALGRDGVAQSNGDPF